MEVQNVKNEGVDDPNDPMKKVYFDNPAPANEEIVFAKGQAPAGPAVNHGDIELQGVNPQASGIVA